MSWVWVQATGTMYAPSGTPFTTGLAGNGADLNNPDAQAIVNHGPLPVGGYTMQTPVENTRLGPCAIPLLPDPTNTMFGRGDFFWHDQSIAHPLDSSDGCIATPGATDRRTAWASPDHRVDVVAEETDRPVPSPTPTR